MNTTLQKNMYPLKSLHTKKLLRMYTKKKNKKLSADMYSTEVFAKREQNSYEILLDVKLYTETN